MTSEIIKRMFDACYQAKRTREMLPPLPEGVRSSFIQYLDTIQSLEGQGVQVKVSDISDGASKTGSYKNCQRDGRKRIP